MAIDSATAAGGGNGGGAKKQRVDALDDRCEAVGSEAIRADRISALPEELRLHILTGLPLKAAIRTGALARGWRGLWKRRWAHRTSLEVRLRSRDDPKRELDALAREPRPRRRLERFSLIVDTCNIKSSEFRRFLDYATECSVEDLHVETKKAAYKLKFHLPVLSPALACLSLRDITVSMFYKGAAQPFHALEVIRLVSVSLFRWDAFKKIMALCPNLHTLYLWRCKCNSWEFCSLPPNLRSLTIGRCGRITSLDFVRVPTLRSFRYYGSLSNLPLSIPRDAALSDLHIQFDVLETLKNWNASKLRKCLPKDLSNLSVLTICYQSLMGVLSNDGISAQLPNFNLHSLKELHLIMFEMEAVNLSNLYMFLMTFQCPNLEALCAGSVHQVREEPPELGLENLVIVKIKYFNWYPTEVQLVSFLLRKASSLRELLIVSRNVTPLNLFGVQEADVVLFKEALANGKIMFSESDDATTQPYHSKVF